jgi:cation transport regulator ChaB
MFQPSFDSGAQPTITTSVFASAFAAARQEYKDNTDTESDGEDGE